MMDIQIDKKLEEIVYLGGVEAIGLQVQPSAAKIDAELAAEIERLRQKYKSPAEAYPLLAPARQMYRAVGVDPTRTRPSSEALIRRALQGKDLYRINSVVDCFNILSMRFALPVGLYDVAHLNPPLVLRMGKAGEGYPGIGKEFVNLESRICFADQEGAFGNPSSDSARTRIRPTSQHILAVYFSPVSLPISQMVTYLEQTSELLQQTHRLARTNRFWVQGSKLTELKEDSDEL